MHFPVAIPGGLSIFISGNTKYQVQGLKDFPEAHWPPLEMTFYSFHLMVVLGMYFIAFPALGLILLWKNIIAKQRWYFWIALFTIPLPFIVNELGWVTAEVGRQPWIVYQVMRTDEAISHSVSAVAVLYSIILFSILYLVIFIVWILALRYIVRRGIDETTRLQPVKTEGK